MIVTCTNRTVDSRPTMKASAVFFRALTLLLLAFVLCFTTYRAALQAIAHDEAVTYLWFLDGSASPANSPTFDTWGVQKVLVFDTNNHVLFTLLAKLFVKGFGITELSLRAASLVGCAVYLLAAFLLCKRLFGDSLLLPMTVAVLILNPTIMDFLAAGRGYGLGLAFLTFAIYFFVCIVDTGIFSTESTQCRRQCTIASAFLALSVAANLSYLIPAISLVASFLAVASQFPKRQVRRFGDGLRALIQLFVIPGLSIGLFILWPFLIQARPKQFYFGYVGISDSAREFINSSFLYKWTDEAPFLVSPAVPSAWSGWIQDLSNIGVSVVLPTFLLFLVGALLFLYWTARASPSNPKSRALLFVSAALGCVVLVVSLYFMAHVKYPYSRAALYAIPLLSISAILTGNIARDLCSGVKRRLLTTVGLVIMLAVIADYVVSLNKSYFRYNVYDRRSRELFLTIRKDAQARRLADVSVGGVWWYEPEIDFYRRRYDAEWLQPYDIKDSSQMAARNSLTPRDYDYFLYTNQNKPDLTGRQIRVIFYDPATDLTAVAIDR